MAGRERLEGSDQTYGDFIGNLAHSMDESDSLSVRFPSCRGVSAVGRGSDPLQITHIRLLTVPSSPSRRPSATMCLDTETELSPGAASSLGNRNICPPPPVRNCELAIHHPDLAEGPESEWVVGDSSIPSAPIRRSVPTHFASRQAGHPHHRPAGNDALQRPKHERPGTAADMYPTHAVPYRYFIVF